MNDLKILTFEHCDANQYLSVFDKWQKRFQTEQEMNQLLSNLILKKVTPSLIIIFDIQKVFGIVFWKERKILLNFTLFSFPNQD